MLTAIGSMLGRAGKQAPEGSPLRADLREIGEVAQTALDNVRGLSQTLHPSILEELGLESTVDWYLSTVERQLGIAVSLRARRHGACRSTPTIGIHVYRVLQEALSNVARHSGADRGVGAAARRAPARWSSRSKITATGLDAAPARARPRPGGDARARGAGRRHARVPRGRATGGTLVRLRGAAVTDPPTEAPA